MAHFVIAHAHFGDQKAAWRTLFLPVAIVCHFVQTTMLSHANVRALERFCAASDRRILNGFTAMANSFLKICHQTSRTLILVT